MVSGLEFSNFIKMTDLSLIHGLDALALRYEVGKSEMGKLLRIYLKADLEEPKANSYEKKIRS